MGAEQAGCETSSLKEQETFSPRFSNRIKSSCQDKDFVYFPVKHLTRLYDPSNVTGMDLHKQSSSKGRKKERCKARLVTGMDVHDLKKNADDITYNDIRQCFHYPEFQHRLTDAKSGIQLLKEADNSESQENDSQASASNIISSNKGIKEIINDDATHQITKVSLEIKNNEDTAKSTVSSLEIFNDNTAGKNLSPKAVKTRGQRSDECYNSLNHEDSGEVTVFDSSEKLAKLTARNDEINLYEIQSNKSPKRHSKSSRTLFLTRSMKSSFKGAENIILTGLPITPRRRLQFDHINHARLAKHACTLWSSDQRRRFQQLYPNLTSTKLDEKLRTTWESLPDKDKQKYFTRARKASRDLDKSRHAEPANKEPLVEMANETHNDYLADRLRKFQSILSTQEYNEFLRLFKIALKNNLDKHSIDGDRGVFSRQLLHIMLNRREREVVKAVTSSEHGRQQRQFNAMYRMFLEKIMVENAFPCADVSAGLTRMFEAIQAVEKQKIPACTKISCKNLRRIAAYLSEAAEKRENHVLVIGNERLSVPRIKNRKFESKCLIELACGSELTELYADDIELVFGDNIPDTSACIKESRDIASVYKMVEENLFEDSICNVANDLEGLAYTTETVANLLTDLLVGGDIITDMIEKDTMQAISFLRTGDHIYCKTHCLN